MIEQNHEYRISKGPTFPASDQHYRGVAWCVRRCLEESAAIWRWQNCVNGEHSPVKHNLKELCICRTCFAVVSPSRSKSAGTGNVDRACHTGFPNQHCITTAHPDRTLTNNGTTYCGVPLNTLLTGILIEDSMKIFLMKSSTLTQNRQSSILSAEYKLVEILTLDNIEFARKEHE
ncbi:hypothetical protein J6590_045276 [Homalodisca vitripennis]|nr:hypothetical protein J6590_045276 [Homalodisca vitripennis]